MAFASKQDTINLRNLKGRERGSFSAFCLHALSTTFDLHDGFVEAHSQHAFTSSHLEYLGPHTAQKKRSPVRLGSGPSAIVAQRACKGCSSLVKPTSDIFKERVLMYALSYHTFAIASMLAKWLGKSWKQRNVLAHFGAELMAVFGPHTYRSLTEIPLTSFTCLGLFNSLQTGFVLCDATTCIQIIGIRILVPSVLNSRRCFSDLAVCYFLGDSDRLVQYINSVAIRQLGHPLLEPILFAIRSGAWLWNGQMLLKSVSQWFLDVPPNISCLIPSI